MKDNNKSKNMKTKNIEMEKDSAGAKAKAQIENCEVMELKWDASFRWEVKELDIVSGEAVSGGGGAEENDDRQRHFWGWEYWAHINQSACQR